MNRRFNIFIFILAIALSLLSIGCIYNVISGRSFKDNLWLLMLINLPFCIVIGLMDFGIIKLTYRMFRKPDGLWKIISDLLVTTLLCIIASGGLNYLLSDAFDLLRCSLPIIPWNWIVVLGLEVFFSHLREADMKKDKAQYQFQLLKNQLNPHFLFNSLNVLASLAYEDADKTNRFAKKLSSVYRYLLQTAEQPTVSVEEELSFVKAYIYLENIRFGDTLKVEIKVGEEAMRRKVIPASIQMLVENAIKHNLNTADAPLEIKIVSCDDGITVSNNLQLRQTAFSTKIGLKNLSRQYALYNKGVQVTSSAVEFRVKIPFLEV